MAASGTFNWPLTYRAVRTLPGHDGPMNGRQLLLQTQNASPVMLERLADLVQCESPSDSPDRLRDCAGLLVPWLTDATDRTVELIETKDRPHLLIPPPLNGVLLLGHFDTVWPVGTLNELPFSVVDGIARGPGVFDMKAGIVQMITALELLDDTSGIGVLLTSDEETGSITSRELIEHHARTARAVLVCEPSADGGDVKIARKGIADYRIDVLGRAAHAGLEPDLGINAGVELAHQILAVGKFADGETTVTPTVLQGGTTANTVPEFAYCAVDVRAWTREELERVDQLMSTLAPSLHGAEIVVNGGINRLPLESRYALPLLVEVQAAARTIGLLAPAGVRSGGGSDGNFTAGLGVPTLDGLGAVGAHPHGRDEQVVVGAMPERAALLAALLKRLSAA